MTTTTQHTAASLAALHSRNPRELDAIAAEIVMGQHIAMRICHLDWDSGEFYEYESWCYEAEELEFERKKLATGDRSRSIQPCSISLKVDYDFDGIAEVFLPDGNHYWMSYFDVIPHSAS